MTIGLKPGIESRQGVIAAAVMGISEGLDVKGEDSDEPAVLLYGSTRQRRHARLRVQPCERQLTRRAALLLGQRLDPLDDGQVLQRNGKLAPPSRNTKFQNSL